MMPRPNVDIAKYITGGVEDYADKHDLSRDDAYEALLLRGLNTVDQPGFASIDSELANLEGTEEDDTTDTTDATD